MAQVLIEENGLEWTARCPNCSDHFLITNYQERDGKQFPIADTSKAPDKCKRCGSPMDPVKAKVFMDKIAGTSGVPSVSGATAVAVMDPPAEVGGDDEAETS